jgi:peptidoglycan/LPS O-acetylase OafA/YrhL
LVKNKYFKDIFSFNSRQDSVIDAVRALSVLCIIAFHVVVGITQVYDFERTKNYILSMPALLQPLWQGEKGVDAFFLISALVLGIPLFSRLESFDWSATWSFYKKRFFRIYPLFLVALILYTITQWSYFGQYFFSNLFLINNLIEGQRTIIPVGWSLLVEVQYYALLPLFLWLLKMVPMRKLLLSAGVVASFIICYFRLEAHPELFLRPITDIFLAEDHSRFTTLIGEFLYESNLTRFGPFAVGLLLAYIKVRHEEHLKNFFGGVFGSAVVFFVALSMWIFGIGLPVYDPQSFYYSPFSPAFNELYLSAHRQIFAVSLALFIMGSWYSDFAPFAFLRRMSNSRFWLPFSRLSFPIYLFHFPFIAISAVMVFGTTNVKDIVSVSFLQGFSLFVLASVLTLIFSIPLHIYIQRPLIEWGRAKSNRTMV